MDSYFQAVLTCVTKAHTSLKLRLEVVSTLLSIILAPGMALGKDSPGLQCETYESVVEAEGGLETPFLAAQAGVSLFEDEGDRMGAKGQHLWTYPHQASAQESQLHFFLCALFHQSLVCLPP